MPVKEKSQTLEVDLGEKLMKLSHFLADKVLDFISDVPFNNKEHINGTIEGLATVYSKVGQRKELPHTFHFDIPPLDDQHYQLSMVKGVITLNPNGPARQKVDHEIYICY
jgi:hypothetical protein